MKISMIATGDTVASATDWKTSVRGNPCTGPFARRRAICASISCVSS